MWSFSRSKQFSSLGETATSKYPQMSFRKKFYSSLFKKSHKKKPSILGNEAFDDNNFLNVKSFPLVLRALGNSHRPFVFRKLGLWNSSSNSPWADGSHWEVWEIDLLLFYRLWGAPVTCCPITLLTLQALPGDLVAKVTLPWQHESALWELGYCLRCLY